MPLELTRDRMTANGLDQHYVIAGIAPPVLLLHGFPGFWYAWATRSRLSQSNTVTAPDLRGYGYTGNPYTGYDKRTMATDIRELMTAPGL